MIPPVRIAAFVLLLLVTAIVVRSIAAEAPGAAALSGGAALPGGDALSGGDEKPIFEGGMPVADPVIVPRQGEVVAAPEGTTFQATPDSLVITVWYGATQWFGQNGDPQKWVNLLGNVSGPSPVSSLTYSLNGGPPQSLNMGPDERRLTQAGDFIIEMDYTELQDGVNQVVITAADGISTPTVAEVTVHYHGRRSFCSPGNYSYDWHTATKISDRGQVVTGQWILNSAAGIIKPSLLAYDRLVALGDLSWRDYTVTVPITIKAIDESGFGAPSNGPGVGVLVRWQGHFDSNGISPLVGWRRLGALAWHRWAKTGGVISSGYQLLGHGGSLLASDARGVTFGETYIFKINVQSNGPGQPATYRFKSWDDDVPEPAGWNFVEQGMKDEPAAGSILLLAHHVDAEFGAVTVQLNSTQPLPALTVNTTGNGQGTVTKAADKSAYLFGEDVLLTAVPSPGSTFNGWSGALSGKTNPASLEMFSDLSVTANFTNSSAVQNPPFTETSDSFFNAGHSIASEDATGSEDTAFTLTVNTAGNGQVTVSPQKSSYLCGEVVTLTAVPDRGWLFLRWSGDLAGTDRVTSLTVYGDQSVTATFALPTAQLYLPSVLR